MTGVAKVKIKAPDKIEIRMAFVIHSMREGGKVAWLLTLCLKDQQIGHRRMTLSVPEVMEAAGIDPKGVSFVWFEFHL